MTITQKSWPSIYSEGNDARYKNLTKAWLGLVDSGQAKVEDMANRYSLPTASAAHAISCAFFDAGEIEKSLKIVNEQLKKELDPLLHIQKIRCLMALPFLKKEEFYRESLEWSKNYLDSSKAKKDEDFLDIDLNPDKRLTLGFLCTYGHVSAAEYGIKPLLQNIDKEKFRIVFFSLNMPGIGWADKMNGTEIEYVDIITQESSIVCKSIEDKKVDLLFDLNGYLRLDFPVDVFTYRPAPVQVSWWNTPTTSGLDTVQYFMSDDYTTPPEDYHHFTEEVCCLESGATLSFDLPDLPITPPPYKNTRIFTFGSFTALFKHNDAVIETWSEIIKRTDNTRLFLKTYGVDEPFVQNRMKKLFDKYGVDINRIIFCKPTRFLEMMQEYQHVDLCLSTFGYGAGTTALNAMWMGVPTISIDGNTAQGRTCATFHNDVGLNQFTVKDREEYIEKAIHYANNPGELDEIRSNMRSRLKDSAHFNPKIFTKDFENGCRKMWQGWLERLPNKTAAS